MSLFRVNMTLDVLIQTGIGRTLKYLQDYCELYQDEFPDLHSLFIKCQKIIEKWKNLVNNIVFEDKKNFMDEFSK